LVISAAVLSATVMSGCSAAGEARAEQVEPPQASTANQQPSLAASLEAEALDDAGICTDFGDVLTIMENADVALAEGRMEAQERDGWHRLAMRVLDRLPSSGDSAVQTAIGDLQQSTVVDSPVWVEAHDALSVACDDLGAPLAIQMFTGG
jgi:hypothetical protein